MIPSLTKSVGDWFQFVLLATACGLLSLMVITGGRVLAIAPESRTCHQTAECVEAARFCGMRNCNEDGCVCASPGMGLTCVCQ